MFYRLTFIWALAFAASTVAAADPPKVVERWALLVGVDDYAYAQKLQFCGADQVAFSQQLIAAGFAQDQVFLLHDKADNPRLRPSLSNINRQLSLILNLANADDLVVIAFSGHGVHLGGKSFLCPSDCTLDDPATLIAVDDVYDRLKECAANFKLVVVDACRNDPRPGGTRSMTATEGTRALARSLQELKVPEGVVLLNSCAPGEVSWEDEKFGHGVFMHYVLDGLQGAADVGGDGSVSLHELQAYAGQRTKTYVANRYAVAQRPFFKGDLTTEALEYALLPVPGGVRKPAAESSGTASIGIMYWGTEDAPVVWFMLKGSLAAAAGFQVNDRIISIGDKKPVNAQQADEFISASPVGVPLDVEIERAGQTRTLRVVPEAYSMDDEANRLLAESEAGVVEAVLIVARLYRDGGPVRFAKNKEASLRLYRRAAETGDAAALLAMGRRYTDGKLMTADYGEARKYFERARAAARADNRTFLRADAAAQLGALYHGGSGVPQDYAAAVQYYREGSELGSMEATCSLANLSESGHGTPKDSAQALELHRKCAAAHYGPSELELGRRYLSGRGVARDLVEARRWFEAGTKHGNVESHLQLAAMLETGTGGPRDPVRAGELQRSVLENVDPESALKIGMSYYHGNSLEYDLSKAMLFIKSAAERGNSGGQTALGELLVGIPGIPADFQAARGWFERAAQNGQADAWYDLGMLYYQGQGVAQDYAKAMDYFLTAAKQKHAKSELAIAVMIYKGEGVEKNVATARGWAESAADHGNVDAMYSLAHFYETGEGGKKDLVRAAEWYRKAAELGHAEAKKRIE